MNNEGTKERRAAGWARRGLIAAICALLAGCSGCGTLHRPAGEGEIVVEKTTCFGFDVSYDAGSSSPHIRIGLIRRFRLRVPTSRQPIYAPEYASGVAADLGVLNQKAMENFATGTGAANALLKAGGTTNSLADKAMSAVEGLVK